MRRHIIGVADPTRVRPWPVDPSPRYVFRSLHIHMNGYYRVIGSAFDVLAARKGCEIFGLNEMLILRGTDLDEVSNLLEQLRYRLENKPKSWLEYLGECILPGGQREVLSPRLFRKRALCIVDQLANMVGQARQDGKLLLYGNGVAFTALDGRPLPPGTEIYS